MYQWGKRTELNLYSATPHKLNQMVHSHWILRMPIQQKQVRHGWMPTQLRHYLTEPKPNHNKTKCHGYHATMTTKAHQLELKTKQNKDGCEARWWSYKHEMDVEQNGGQPNINKTKQTNRNQLNKTWTNQLKPPELNINKTSILIPTNQQPTGSGHQVCSNITNNHIWFLEKSLVSINIYFSSACSCEGRVSPSHSSLLKKGNTHNLSTHPL